MRQTLDPGRATHPSGEHPICDTQRAEQYQASDTTTHYPTRRNGRAMPGRFGSVILWVLVWGMIVCGGAVCAAWWIVGDGPGLRP